MAPTSHEYPGINLPLPHMEAYEQNNAGVDFYRCGSFPGAPSSLSGLMQVREVAMLVLMDRLTDKPDWNKKVFDDSIVANWRHEALMQDETDLSEAIVTDHTLVPMPSKRTRFINEAAFNSGSKLQANGYALSLY
jgi:hypothetical protein